MNASAFLPLCKQIIVWRPLAGRDNYGAPIYGSTQVFRGRRTYKASRVASYERGTKGQGPEVISESQIWLLGIDATTGANVPVPNIKYEDQVFVEGDDLARLPPILSIGSPADESGSQFFVKVSLGSSNG